MNERNDVPPADPMYTEAREKLHGHMLLALEQLVGIEEHFLPLSLNAQEVIRGLVNDRDALLLRCVEAEQQNADKTARVTHLEGYVAKLEDELSHCDTAEQQNAENAKLRRILEVVKNGMGESGSPSKALFFDVMDRDLDALQQQLTEARAQLKEEKEHLAILEAFIRQAVDVASVFQDGELRGVLPLGSSTVIDGMKWLLAQRDALREYAAHKPLCVRNRIAGNGCASPDFSGNVCRICGLDSAAHMPDEYAVCDCGLAALLVDRPAPQQRTEKVKA